MRIRFSNKIDFEVSSWTVQLAILFLITDLSFIVLHLIYQFLSDFTTFVPNFSFSLEADRGFAEIFQYIKEYWIALLLGFLALQKRSMLFLSWSLVFLYIFLDDALLIHEKLGKYLSTRLGFSSLFNLRAEDFGELLVTGSAGVVLLILVAGAYYFSDRRERKVSRVLIGFLFSLAIIGIAVDMLHVVLMRYPLLDLILSILEDGGELVIMSAIALFVIELTYRQTFPTASAKQPVEELVGDRK